MSYNAMNNTPTIKAIPTYYQGVRFRSRLEAKWAALFDQLNWSWTYEPYDLEGWAPDFAIKGKRGDILVEVKPVPGAAHSPEFDKAANHKAVSGSDILLLGHSPIREDEHCFIGLCNEVGMGSYFERAVVGKWNEAVTEGYCNEIQSYHDRISGKSDGGYFGRQKPRDLMLLWGQASNLVQWVPN